MLRFKSNIQHPDFLCYSWEVAVEYIVSYGLKTISNTIIFAVRKSLVQNVVPSKMWVCLVFNEGEKLP